ncbi:hypothetical protein [Roseateles puraquae]|uniref:hypothetical protein n=1 Tax=Roseateles puraquae TaxID=431059 RepID=UPI0031D75683
MTHPAPYPADTRAKGWRFELDYEQIEQSSTWDLAAQASPELRPWLLMMWLVSWKQVPCGSFPADEVVIAAKIGMPAKTWAKHRELMLRGWTVADDGRIYHETISARVAAMLKAKESERQRKADYRARKDAERAGAGGGTQPDGQGGPPSVPELSHGTDDGQTRTGHGKDDTGTGTGTNEYKYPPTPQRGAGRASTRATRPPAVEPPGFEAFWSAYPRKVGKAAAVKAFAKVAPSEDLLRGMLGAVAEQRQSTQWVKDGGQFVPHPATWLNQQRWLDEGGASGGSSGGLQLPGAL